ncbi:single-stranded DNA-binding protein [Treponema sp. R6D11]
MLNKAIIMGRLTRDPELKTTPSGVSVCSFSVAVDRRFVRQGEERQTDFINCVAWRTTAEFVSKYFTKGRMINVVGTIQTRSWDDADGKKRYATDVVADEVNFCGDKRAEGSSASSAPSSSPAAEEPVPHDEGFVAVDLDDDLPF